MFGARNRFPAFAEMTSPVVEGRVPPGRR